MHTVKDERNQVRRSELRFPIPYSFYISSADGPYIPGIFAPRNRR